MLIFPAALLLLCFALFIASSLRISGRSLYLLALYLLSCASAVLVFEIAGLLHGLGSQALFLALQSSLTLAAGFIWWRNGKPHLLGPFRGDIRSVTFTRIGETILRHPALWLLALAVDLAYSVNAYIILVVPPNNNDSLYLHMARVIRWLQTGSFLPYPTTFTRQLYYSINAQSLIHWTVLFWNSDQLASFVQFSAALATMLCVYLLARKLGFSRPQGAFAALIWATFPQVFLQSTTTQNDLVPAAFFAGALVFFIHGIRSSDRQAGLILSVIGLALALGAKQTVFFLLPGFAGFILLFVFQRRSAGWAFLIRWIPAAALSFVLLGGIIYIVNTVEYGNPMGETATVAKDFHTPVGGLPSDAQPEEVAPLRAFWINLNRIAYQFIDTTGLPPIIEGYLFRGKAHLARVLYGTLNLPLESSIAVNPNTVTRFNYLHRPPIQEDETWFGIFAPLLMVPAAIIFLVRSFRRHDPLPAGLWMIACSFVLLELIFRPGWDGYLGRNFSLAVIVLAPFLAGVYQPGRAARLGIWLVAVLAIYVLWTLIINNTAKPLTGKNAIWDLNRYDKLTFQNHKLKEPAVLVNTYVPADTVLALPDKTWEYPFYDEHFHRRLVQTSQPDLYTDLEWLREQGVKYMLVKNETAAEIDMPVEFLVSGSEWTVLRLP